MLTSREIKALLILKGVTQVSIAKKLGVAPSLVSMVINGQEKNTKVRRAIAEVLGYSVQNIWPKDFPE